MGFDLSKLDGKHHAVISGPDDAGKTGLIDQWAKKSEPKKEAPVQSAQPSDDYIDDDCLKGAALDADKGYHAAYKDAAAKHAVYNGQAENRAESYAAKLFTKLLEKCKQ